MFFKKFRKSKTTEPVVSKKTIKFNKKLIIDDNDSINITKKIPYDLKFRYEAKRVKTLRDLNEINEAISAQKQIVIIKRIKPNYEIKSQYVVYRNLADGTLHLFDDFRSEIDANFEQVMNYDTYYPMAHSCPIAAYVLPKNAKVGDVFFIEDLIEEITYLHHQMSTVMYSSIFATFTESGLSLHLGNDSNEIDPVQIACG